MTIWITSDTHFNHLNIIEYCRRPFFSPKHMNEEMIRRWNSFVSTDDLVYHGGDFAMGSKDEWAGFGQALQGHKILTRGNHDQHKMIEECGFQTIADSVYFKYGGLTYWLSHIPVGSVRQGDVRDYQRPVPTSSYDVALCGHVHGAWKINEAYCINVGVDAWGFDNFPLPMEEVHQFALRNIPNIGN